MFSQRWRRRNAEECKVRCNFVPCEELVTFFTKRQVSETPCLYSRVSHDLNIETFYSAYKGTQDGELDATQK